MKGIPASNKSNKIIVICLILSVVLALGVRVGIICYNPEIAPMYGEMTRHAESARNLVEGRGYVTDWEYFLNVTNLITTEHKLFEIQDVQPPQNEQFKPNYAYPPGTSALLAGTYLVFGEYRFIYLRVIQAIIDAFGCLFMFFIGRSLFSRKIGLIAAFLYALWLPIASLATWPLHDALMPFITLVSLYFFIRGVQSRTIKFYILSALFVGIGCYFQPTILLLPLFFGLGLFVYYLKKENFREQVINVIKVTAVMITVLVLIISPWIVRNYRVTGAVIGMRAGLWQGIWEGLGEFANPVGAVLCDITTYQQVKEEVGYDIEYGTPEYDAILRDKALNAIKEYPGWWLSVLARRVPRTIVYAYGIGLERPCPQDEQGNVLQVECQRRNPSHWMFTLALKDGTLLEFIKNHPYSTFYWGLIAFFAVVPVLLSMVGIWAERKRWRNLVLVATLPAYLSAVHVFIFTSGAGKTLMPGSLAYIIFSAIALEYIYRKMKGKMTPGRESALSLD